MSQMLPLDRVTALALDPGASVVVRGVTTTTVDGSSFDAAMQYDTLATSAWHPGGLFDLAAGGLRIVEQHPERHEYVLASDGRPGPACAAAGAPSPCLVPRLATLAHERLKTQGELASSLTGGVELQGVIAPPPVLPETAVRLEGAGVVLAAIVAAGLAVIWLRRRALTPLVRVRRAAREALRATRGDPTLDAVRTQVRAMVARAGQLDGSRRACARRLGRVDRTALDLKRRVYAVSAAPGAADALAWLAAEQDETLRVERDLASSVMGLQRIESALRVVTLRVREDRGTRARIARHDPVDGAAVELLLREEAMDEADGTVRP
jgi:hypothetical protein